MNPPWTITVAFTYQSIPLPGNRQALRLPPYVSRMLRNRRPNDGNGYGPFIACHDKALGSVPLTDCPH